MNMSFFQRDDDLYLEMNGDVEIEAPRPWAHEPDPSKKNLVYLADNIAKYKEVFRVLAVLYNGNIPFNFIYMETNLPEIQGDPDVVFSKKALAAFDLVKGPCVVEYNSLCCNAINGLPGIYNHRFLEKVGPQGLNLMLAGFEDKSAKAICTLAYTNEKGKVSLFHGVTNGKIVSSTQNSTEPETFGWESIFMPNGYDTTFSVMTMETKIFVSPRMKATFELKDFFDQNNIQF